VRGREYTYWVADLRPFGLARLTRNSRESLERAAAEALGPLTGEMESLTLKQSALRSYERSLKCCLAMRMELDTAVLRLESLLGLAKEKGCAPEEAISYWARHHDSSKYREPLSGVVNAFLQYLSGENGNSREDVAGVRSKLRRFASHFSGPLASITGEQYREYFGALSCGARSRLNHRNEVRRLVGWARDHGFLPVDHPGVPRYAGKVKVAPKRVEVFSIQERERMLEQASEVELPMVLLKAYTPLRQKESSLVEWQDIDFEMGSLVVWADRAKTRQARMIHLPSELSRRLRPLARESGPLYPHRGSYAVSPRLARKAGVAWIRNGWRCTVISHLQALLDNLARVAEEAGTSVQKLKSNYLLPGIRPDIASAYLGLRHPEKHPLEAGYQREESLPLENVIPCEFRSA
jgi:hypothetical protein